MLDWPWIGSKGLWDCIIAMDCFNWINSFIIVIYKWAKMWTQNRLYSNSWWLITQLRKGPTWRNEHIWAAIVHCLLSSFLRLFCTVLLGCMWHAWLMRHYQKVSQANNFRRGQKSSKANKNPCILAGKQWRQTGRQAGRKVAYGAFALSLAEVVKISLILLLPCSVLDCVLVSLFTFVFMCVCP